MERINIRRHIFEYIVDQRERSNYQPCRSEIRKVFSGLSDDVDLHVEQLAREGLLMLGADGKQVSLTPPFSASRLIKLWRGSYAGTPDVLAIDLQAVGVNMTSDLLARVVEDDSMIDAGIRKQDIAICRAGVPAQGEIVLAELSGKLVFRRYFIIKDIPHLLAENRSCPDLSAAFDVHMHGVLCCVISPRSKPTAGSTLQELRKVNYVQGAAPTHKRTRWPATPFGIGLNDKIGRSYKASRWHRTSEDPPERAYGHAHSQAQEDFSNRKQKVQGAEKVKSKRIRASDIPPIKNPAPETSKNKGTQRVRARLRV